MHYSPTWPRLIVLALLLANPWTTMAEETTAPENAIALVLPKVIHAVVGLESNVYFDNTVLVLNADNYAFDVTCKRGRQEAKRWTYTPLAGEEGSYAFSIDVRDASNTVIAQATSLVTVHTPNPAESPRSMLLIGDSLTHAGVYSQHLMDLGAMDAHPAVTLIGSHGTAPNVHEGYGGWTAKRFATHYTATARTGHYKERGSPFLYEDAEGKRALDFKRYCDDVNGGKIPDYITIFLGCNDTFSATDETIQARIDDMVMH